MASIFDKPEYKPLKAGFDARSREMSTFVDWYTGNIYNGMNQRVVGEFDAKVKALYHPLARAVNLHASFLPGFPAYKFTEDHDDPQGDPIKGTAQSDQDAIKKMLRWSRWAQYGPLFHMNFALRGRGLITVVTRDLIDPNRPVVLDVPNPMTTMPIYADKWSLLPDMLITVEQRTLAPAKGQDPVQKEYAVIVTKEQTLRFFDGEPYNDPNGLFSAAEANSLGFVPAIEARFRDIGDGTEQNVFTQVIPIISTVNRLATYIMGVIGQHFKPQAFISGAERGDEDIEWGEGFLYGPEGSDAKLLLAQLDISGATKFVENVHDQIRRNLPELIFDDIAGINRISTEGLELQFAELISKLTVTRGTSDRALDEAWKLGLFVAQEAGSELKTNVPPPDDPAWDDYIIELDPMRGYVPFGQSALIAVEQQQVSLDTAKEKLRQLQAEGDQLLENMKNGITNAGASGPGDGTGLIPKNDTSAPLPKDGQPDAGSPGPKAVDKQKPVE